MKKEPKKTVTLTSQELVSLIGKEYAIPEGAFINWCVNVSDYSNPSKTTTFTFTWDDVK